MRKWCVKILKFADEAGPVEADGSQAADAACTL